MEYVARFTVQFRTKRVQAAVLLERGVHAEENATSCDTRGAMALSLPRFLCRPKTRSENYERWSQSAAQARETGVSILPGCNAEVRSTTRDSIAVCTEVGGGTRTVQREGLHYFSVLRVMHVGVEGPLCSALLQRNGVPTLTHWSSVYAASCCPPSQRAGGNDPVEITGHALPIDPVCTCS